MWRIGLHDQAKKQKPNDQKRKATATNSKINNKAPRDALVSSEIQRRTRPPSVTISEHPMRRLGGKSPKVDYHQSTFMAARANVMQENGISGFHRSSRFANSRRPLTEENSMRRLSTSDSLSRRRSSSSFNYNVIKEIRERVKKVVTEFETAPGGSTQDEDILRDIQENLPSIQDDMLRINVTALLGRYRQMLEHQEQSLANAYSFSPISNEKDDLLKSVHNWMEEEKMKTIDEADEELFLMPDTQLIEEYIDSVQSTVKKISHLKDKIEKCKAIGANSFFLEKQSKNLKRQMKEEILNKEYKKLSKGSKGANKKHEFTYLKNAATEIYNLLRKTRTEGSEEKKKFEEDLSEIVKMVEEKEKMVTFLEKRVDEQTKLVTSWCNDYEKLQGEYVIMEDQAQIEKNEKLKINEALEETKEKLRLIEERNDKNYVDKSQHTNQINAFDQKIRLLKQQNEIMAYNLREKEYAIDEHARQIQMLKAALRRGSDASYRSAVSATSIKVNEVAPPAPPCVSLTQISTSNFAPAKATESLLMLEIDALKKKLDNLTDENKKLKVQMYQQAHSQMSMMSTMSKEIVSPSSSNASVRPSSKEMETTRGSSATVAASKSSRVAASKSSRVAAPKGSNATTTQKSASKSPIQKPSASGTQQKTTSKPQKASSKSKGAKPSPTASELKLDDKSSIFNRPDESITVFKAPETPPVPKVILLDQASQAGIDSKTTAIDTSDLRQFTSRSIAIQASSIVPRNSVVAELTENERIVAFEALRRLNETLGNEWKHHAINISKLKPTDVEEFSAMLSSEFDVKTMWTSLESNEPDEKVSGVRSPSAHVTVASSPVLKPSASKPVKTTYSDTKNQAYATTTEGKTRIEENVLASHLTSDDAMELLAADSGIKLTKEDIKACTVSDSIATLTENMLSGNIPTEIQVVDKGVEHILHEAESMTFKIGNFIDKVQGLIGCQTDMMQQANDAIKEALPEELRIVVEEAEPDVEARESGSGDMEEIAEDWKHLSAAEQVQHKLKGVEDAMREMVHESMNVFVGEVVKQHAAYSRIHEVVNENSPNQAGFGFVADKKLAVQSIKQRVEASMRSMARVNRAQRKKISLYVDKRRSFEDSQVRKHGVSVEGAPLIGLPKSTLSKLLRIKSPTPKFGAKALSTLIDSQLSGKRIRKSEHQQQLHDHLINAASKSSRSIKEFRQRLKSAANNKTRWKTYKNSQIQPGLTKNPPVLVGRVFGQISGRQAPPSPVETLKASVRKPQRKSFQSTTVTDHDSLYDLRPTVTLSAIRDQINKRSRLSLPKQPGIADSVLRVNSNFYSASRPRSTVEEVDPYLSGTTPSYHPPSPTFKLPVL